MELPSFSCICELCDCGRHKHHKDCKRQQSVQCREIKGHCFISHYKATFEAPRNAAARSSKRPPRTPAYANLPPMNLVTTQQAEFIPRPLEGRAKPFVPPEGYYQSPEEPLLSKTLYSLHYAPKEAERTMGTRPKDNLHVLPPSSTNHTTTTKAEYKEWKAECQPQFGELPDLAGSLLFPGDTNEMKTTTQDHYVEKKTRRVNLVKAAQCHLVTEGEHHMETTHQSTYHPLPLEKGTVKNHVTQKVTKRPQMEVTTKYQSDFPTPHSLPQQTRAALPPPDNLGVNTHLRNDFKTVQRETFPGWDPLLHPRPEPAQLKEELTVMDRERGGQVDGNTVTKLAFSTPAWLPREPNRRPRSILKPLNATFDGSTHNKTVYKNWVVQPHWRHGDPRDGISLRPMVKLESETTTGSTFVPKKGETVRICKPKKGNLELTGESDFNTVHRETYRIPQLPQCRLQIYLQQQKGNASLEGKENPKRH
ncbi:stabilizer of axonemal microtubules 1 isoform X1 [Xenopus laevis]|uniref:Stabilizer of axonemal microtubules 1 isoform X1 n=1 Tax=Xenopus laevis TaxID=8355 RepID=A0A8J0T2A2_XENLA|nr:stabilizer of axonemal microtubules 1 isoform X1 [Xenopus laevis]